MGTPYRTAPIIIKSKAWEVVGRSTFGNIADEPWKVIATYRWRWMARLKAWWWVLWTSGADDWFGYVDAEAMVQEKR